MNTIFYLMLSVSVCSLYSSQVEMRYPRRWDPSYLSLPKKYQSGNPISSLCFDSTGTVLAIAAGKTVILHRMHHKKEGNFLTFAPGRFGSRYHFEASVDSISLREPFLYVSTSREDCIH